MTRDEPRQMLATNSSRTPSCQFVPLTRNSAEAATAPVQANPANSFVGWALRSAMPPTKMRKIAETIVVAVTVNGTSDPGRTARPRMGSGVGHCSPEGSPGQAASVATEVR